MACCSLFSYFFTHLQTNSLSLSLCLFHRVDRQYKHFFSISQLPTAITLLSLFNLTTIESFSLCLCYFSFQYFLFTLSHLYILLSLSLSFFHAYTIWLEYYFIYLFLSFMISLSQLYILSLSLLLFLSTTAATEKCISNVLRLRQFLLKEMSFEGDLTSFSFFFLPFSAKFIQTLASIFKRVWIFYNNFPASFSWFSFFSIQLTVNKCSTYKSLPMTGFEPRTSGVECGRIIDWATTTAFKNIV